MNALILVDLQKDFAPGGALAVPEAGAVVPVANLLMDRFGVVAATQDWHPADHLSFAANHPGTKVGQSIQLNGEPQILWPTHCVQDTPGADFIDGLNQRGIHQIIKKGTDPKIDSYSGFFDNGHGRSTELGSYLRRHLVDRVYIMGVATDYCVKFTALDSVLLGFETFVILDGCRGVDLHQGDIMTAIEQMRSAGVTIMDSHEV